MDKAIGRYFGIVGEKFQTFGAASLIYERMPASVPVVTKWQIFKTEAFQQGLPLRMKNDFLALIN